MHPIYTVAKACSSQILSTYGAYIPDYNKALLTAMSKTKIGTGPNDTLKKYVTIFSDAEWVSERSWHVLGTPWRNAYNAAQGHGTPAITVPRLKALTEPDYKKYTEQKFIFVRDQKYTDEYLRHVITHELIHWVTHRHFVAQVKSNDDTALTVKEGTTEYLTRRLLNLKDDTGVYDAEAGYVERVVTESKDTFEQFAKAFFGGKDKLETLDDFAGFFAFAVQYTLAGPSGRDSKKSAGGKT